MPRLDRLSALLGGLSASVDIRHAGPLLAPFKLESDIACRLDLHLVTAGRVVFNAGEQRQCIDAPGALICGSSNAQARWLEPGESGESGESGENAEPPQLLAAVVSLNGPAGKLLQDAFKQPAVLALDDRSDDLAHLLAFIRVELSHPRCGHGTLLARAGEIVLITILRHIIARPVLGKGLLSALADPRIAQAVVALHESPNQIWTLASMAESAGMSRTAFATGFRQRMGLTPGAYLGSLRLGIAEQQLAAGTGLKRAAQAAGYASPATLSRALSRKRGKAEAKHSG